MLDYFALFVLVFAAITVFYGVIVIHDIPYEIAHRRDHPHADAIHVAGWVSLFTLHVLWPFLWIWATLYGKDKTWGFATEGSGKLDEVMEKLDSLSKRIEELEAKGGDE